ncbi:hypothetical protein F5148DRAFT_1229215, partial [Russula earlei]
TTCNQTSHTIHPPHHPCHPFHYLCHASHRPHTFSPACPHPCFTHDCHSCCLTPMLTHHRMQFSRHHPTLIRIRCHHFSPNIISSLCLSLACHCQYSTAHCHLSSLITSHLHCCCTCLIHHSIHIASQFCYLSFHHHCLNCHCCQLHPISHGLTFTCLSRLLTSSHATHNASCLP